MRRSSLNHAYRLVWSHSRNAWIAVAETARSRGKGGRRARALSAAVVAALGALAGPAAHAACLTLSGDSTVTGATGGVCLSGSANLIFTSSGTVSGGMSSDISGVLVTNHTTVGGIANDGGLIRGELGINIDGAGLANITNRGRIEGLSGSASSHAVSMNAGTIAGGLVNEGFIGSAQDAIHLQGGSTIGGGITNSGTLAGDDKGIVARTGSVIGGGITNSGTITAGGIGISLEDHSTLTGDLINEQTGSIGGGINLSTYSSVTGAIVNQGLIGLSSSIGGINVTGHSSVSAGITNSGTIYGASVGIKLDDHSSTSTLFNSGSISGSTGIKVANGSSVTGDVTNSGTLSGSSIGMLVEGGSVGEIINSGTTSAIEGSSRGLAVTNSVLGGIRNEGTIGGNNGGISLLSSSITGGINNSGRIWGDQGITLLVGDYSTVDGDIVNDGEIVTLNRRSKAISVGTNSTIGGNIINRGSIAGKIGIAVQTNASVEGGISNSGTLSGIDAGIRVRNSHIGGDIDNSGTLIGNWGIDVSGDFSAQSTIAGAIDNSGDMLGSNGGIRVQHGTVSGGITNSGSISISGGTSAMFGLYLEDIQGAGVVNSGTVSVDASGMGGDAAAAYFRSDEVGGITNDGTLAASGDSSVNGMLFTSTVVNGDIVNGGTLSATKTGTLSGDVAAFYLLGNNAVHGSIINDGKIISSGRGIAALTSTSGIIGTSVTGAIANTGTITADDVAILANKLKVGGGLINSGTMSSDVDAVVLQSATIGGNVVDGTLTGGLVNSGTISSGQTGITIDGSTVSGALVNSGMIDSGFAGIVLKSDSTLAGSLVNQGVIDSHNDVALYLKDSTIQGDVINSGTVTAHVSGLSVRTSASIQGAVVNSGTIGGDIFGIAVAAGGNIAGGIINSGTIGGNQGSIYIGTGADVPTLTIAGNNTARFIGAVTARNTEVIVASGAKYTMRGGERFDVSGLLDGSIANRFTNNGDLGVAAGATGTITGNYVQDANATFRTTVDGNGNSGKLVVTGTATLVSNAKINVDVTGNFSLSHLDGILSAGTLDSDGTFVTTTNSRLFKFTAVKDGNEIDLEVSKTAQLAQIARAARNKAALGAAGALDRILDNNPQGELADLFNLTSDREINNALSQSLPVLTGSSQVATRDALGAISRVIQARQEANGGLSSGDALLAQGHFWLKSFGSWADQNDHDNLPGYDANTTGLALGVDGVVSDATRLGLSFAYSRSDIDGDSSVAPSSVDVSLFQLLGYGSHSLGQDTEINFQLGFGKAQNDSRRHIYFADSTAKADYDSWTGTAGIGLGRSYSLADNLRFTPSLRADYTWIKDESYREHGADALDLKVKGRGNDALILGLDGKFNVEFQQGMVLSANLGVGYDVLNDDSSITAAYAGAPGAAFRTEGVDVNPWLVRGGLGLSKTLGGTELSLRYDVEHRVDFLNQSASVKLRWAF